MSIGDLNIRNAMSELEDAGDEIGKKIEEYERLHTEHDDDFQWKIEEISKLTRKDELLKEAYGLIKRASDI